MAKGNSLIEGKRTRKLVKPAGRAGKATVGEALAPARASTDPTRRVTLAGVAGPVLDALPDTIDFRDRLYIPTLVLVPPTSDMAGYRASAIPVLDQGNDGACTGFALATVANYLLRVRRRDPTADEVSAWMLYAMAKRYDEWPGEDYDGSSARGAVKGWYKNGLCSLALWRDKVADHTIEACRAADAIKRPLGAYFRVNHRDLVAMHAALSEVGILFATAGVHTGWQELANGGSDIPFSQVPIGGHAFAIVGYDQDGFWIQNSWGTGWGDKGLARLSYDDWLANGSDVWVAALGAPVRFNRPFAGAALHAGTERRLQSHVYADLRPHIITAKNDGVLDAKGDYGLTPDGLKDVITVQMPKRMEGWKVKRVVLYAHGGLVSQDSAVQTVANNRDPMLQAEVYPLSFVWRSDAWSTIKDILQDVMARRRDEALLDRSKDFMLNRLDDMLEPLARVFGGKALWDEMKENALRATSEAQGAARLAADLIAPLLKDGTIDELHLVGHSAGSIFHAPLARYLAGKEISIASLTLWAPACTIELFNDFYRPLIESGKIRRFDLYTLSDATERSDNCANIYHKSLLYLVSAAFEQKPRIPLIRDAGWPLLGRQRDLASIEKSFWNTDRHLHIAPGADSGAVHHGDFDNDPATLLSTLHRIVGEAVDAGTRRAAYAVTRASRDQRRQLREVLNDALAR